MILTHHSYGLGKRGLSLLATQYRFCVRLLDFPASHHIQLQLNKKSLSVVISFFTARIKKKHLFSSKEQLLIVIDETSSPIYLK
jgi:hypothetical protein